MSAVVVPLWAGKLDVATRRVVFEPEVKHGSVVWFSEVDVPPMPHGCDWGDCTGTASAYVFDVTDGWLPCCSTCALSESQADRQAIP